MKRAKTGRSLTASRKKPGLFSPSPWFCFVLLGVQIDALKETQHETKSAIEVDGVGNVRVQ